MDLLASKTAAAPSVTCSGKNNQNTVKRKEVIYLGGVTSGGGTVLLEGWLKLLEAFEGGFRSDTIVLGDGDFLDLSFSILLDGLDWDDFFVIESLLLGFKGLSVGFNGHFVLFFSADAEFLSNVFRSLSHGEEGVSGLRMVEDGLGDLFRVEG